MRSTPFRLSVTVSMARRKTTVYIEDELLTATKVAAARAHKHEYEIFEEALRRHLGLQEVVERVWSGLGDDALSEEESLRLAVAERAAERAEKRSARQAG
jgi:hypothetical protein